MELSGILVCEKDFLTPADIAVVLGSDPQTIRETAKEYPERIGYPFTFVGNRMKIPKAGFLRWMNGMKGNTEVDV